MKSFFEKAIPSLFVGLILFIFGIAFNIIKENNQNQKRYIDLRTDVDFDKFDSTELKEKNFQILYNGNAVYGAFTSTVELFNFSDKDYEDIKVQIVITPKEGDALQLVETEYYGPHGHKDGVVQINNNSEQSLKGSLKFEYLIETANRADSAKDLMFKTYYGITCKERPKLSVSVLGKGIEKRKFSPAHYEKIPFWESDIAIVIYVIFGYVLLLIAIFKIGNYFNNKKTIRWRSYLIKNLKDKIDNRKVNFEAEDIANTYREISDRFDYEDASPLMRRLKRLKLPSQESSTANDKDVNKESPL